MKTPIYLNLLKIELPISGIVSILHRLSGILLILSIPLVLWIFGNSISSLEDFNHMSSLLNSSTANIAKAILAWSLIHHILAGIRFLLIDIDIGVNKKPANISASILAIVSLFSLSFFIGLALL